MTPQEFGSHVWPVAVVLDADVQHLTFTRRSGRRGVSGQRHLHREPPAPSATLGFRAAAFRAARALCTDPGTDRANLGESAIVLLTFPFRMELVSASESSSPGRMR